MHKSIKNYIYECICLFRGYVVRSCFFHRKTVVDSFVTVFYTPCLDTYIPALFSKWFSNFGSLWTMYLVFVQACVSSIFFCSFYFRVNVVYYHMNEHLYSITFFPVDVLCCIVLRRRDHERSSARRMHYAPSEGRRIGYGFWGIESGTNIQGEKRRNLHFLQGNCI